jgi:hypothetical protein
LFVLSLICIATAIKEKKRTIIRNKNIIIGDKFNMWKKIYNKITVAKEPKVPGIFGILPIPNIVTK